MEKEVCLISEEIRYKKKLRKICGFILSQETERAKEQLKTALSVLNQYLETRTFLVGERISQADITVVCDLLLAYQYVSILYTVSCLHA